MKFINYILSSNLEFDANCYRLLFFEDNKSINKRKLLSHFKKYFVRNSNFNNKLYKIPIYIDFKFIFKYYNIKKDSTSRYNFLLKYINHPHIIHFDFALERYNYGFIHQFYNISTHYNLNFMYDYILKKNKNIKYYNSRQCILNIKKNVNPIIVIYNIHFDIHNINFINNNLDKLININYFYKLIIIYTIDNNELESDIDKIFNDITYDCIIIKYSDYIKYVKNFSQINNLLTKKYFLAYYLFTALKITNPSNKYTYLLLNSNLYIHKDINDIIEYYFSIGNIYLSLFDLYNADFSYNVSLDFLITDHMFFNMTYFSNNFKTSVNDCFRNIKNNDNNLKRFAVAYISIDHFLPYYHRLFNRISILQKPHLLMRMNCPIIDYKFIDYLNIYNNNNNSNNNVINVENIKVAVVAHIGKLETRIFDNLIQISESYTHYHFIFYLTVNDKIKKSKLFKYIKDKSYDRLELNIIFVENIGADLYPFIYSYIKYIINIKDVQYVLKLHTKTDVLWRNDMIYPFTNMFDKCIQILDFNKNIGCVCSREWILKNDFLNNEYLLNFYKKYNQTNLDDCIYEFVGGTIFLIKKHILDDFFINLNIDLDYERDMFSKCFDYEQHKSHNEIHYSHCWERIISGYTTYISKCNIYGL
jgi:hypothetical protein